MNNLWTYGFLVIIVAACNPGKNHETVGSRVTYTCPMHPQIVQGGPADCPICGMELVPATKRGGEQSIMLDERQIALAGIQTAPVTPGSIGSRIFLTGEVIGDKELTRAISSRAAGRIEKLYIKETGQRIGKGQRLYEIYSEELLTRQKEYLLMLEQYRQLGSERNRYASFMESAKKKLLLYGMAASQVEQLTETGMLSPTITFLSPVSGVVTDVSAAEGLYVAEGSPLYKIEGLNRLWVEAELYPREAALVGQGDEVQVVVNGFESEPAKGKVIFLNPEYRTGTQIITLRAEIPNPDGRFVPGMQANIILSNGAREVLTVPVNSVIRDEHGMHIWVKTGKGIFVPRMVTTGLETFTEVEILGGVKEGDTVVVSGAYLLYSELVLKKGAQAIAGMEMPANHFSAEK